MKACGQETEVTLPIHGRERTFSQQELIDILEEYFFNEDTERVTTTEVVQKPTEGKWFEVKPLSIDQTLFQNRRDDKAQEETRQYILEAFFKMKKNPKKYGKNFKTMFLERRSSFVAIWRLKRIAEWWGDHNADWVEQSLEWAQRIANGESWEDVCNVPDTANWYRLVIGKNEYPRLVGGSAACKLLCSASRVHKDKLYLDTLLEGTVPLVVSYD